MIINAFKDDSLILICVDYIDISGGMEHLQKYVSSCGGIKIIIKKVQTYLDT
jgi:hypothetical protein